MCDALFVPDPLATYINEDALQRLAFENDTRFAGPDGIIAVDRARWQKAQEYERKTWMEVARTWTDARNYEFAWGFDAYHALPGELGHVIEFGAGPFSNGRLILERHHAAGITLLDPLIRDYLQRDGCPYWRGELFDSPVTIAACAIEDWTPEPYDTAILINTLHHCQNADVALAHLDAALRPGGWLIFYELPREIDPAKVYDVGHPLAPTANYLRRWLAQYEEVYRNGWYFIGRKP